MTLLLVLGPGCVWVHFQHNAPGDINVEKPPKRMECEFAERPADPGEEMLFFTTGVLAGAGVTVDSKSEASLQADMGLEGSVLLGTSETSHQDDFPIGANPLWVRSLGINFGWVFSARHEQGTPLYLELQAREKMFGVAAGLMWLSGTDIRGPQVTAFWGPFYVRYTHLVRFSDDVTAGLILKIPFALVWSR